MGYEPLYHACSKNMGKHNRILGALLSWFYFSFFLCFGSIFNKTIIPLTLVGHEMIITNLALCTTLAIYHKIYIKTPEVQTQQHLSLRLMFFFQNCIPLANSSDVLTVSDIYRLQVLKFIHLWHKSLLPSLFHDLFQHASEVHEYNTRYPSEAKSVHSNSGKRTITSTTTILWDNTLLTLKISMPSTSLNKWNFIYCLNNIPRKICFQFLHSILFRHRIEAHEIALHLRERLFERTYNLVPRVLVPLD